ncbi:undecaprenyl/decaprenyl-phosphate alpha-N-acetylglucosaminyl 1-phosphate transferase [Paracrocinitomix mangrovi]|uniref:glycosyltransferase family 4 protein n=1 Tax=Paracrocinitomix mangrovi TaxID=2862509 RepID=UPI001C8E59DF|nr:MraY family glycosyltransferase [Paracrocinitomix mangrovi]UKN03421.1 undecaprenyl/decaprenyl-phosphate alpha-N-acetylglucosaminyl 1-phosphate transferase [Paracrocinitomix mangrovi]
MKDYHLVLVFLTAFGVVLLATPSLIKVAKLKHLVDEPSEDRKLHTRSIPTIGGIIIFSAFIFSSLLWFPDHSMIAKAELGQFNYLMASLILLFFVGVKDDIIGMSPMKKLLAHLMVGFILVVMGEIRITSFQGLLGMDIELPEYGSILISIFAYIVIVNAINLVDGVDGLASGVGLIAAAAFGVWFSYTGAVHWALVSFSLSGALLGFLVFNFNPARIFMGDSGSLSIGAILSVLAIKLIDTPIETLPVEIQYVSKPVLAMTILAYPLLDTLRVFSIRIASGRSPLSADRNHLHHKMLDQDNNHKKTVIIIYIFTLIMIGQAFFLQFPNPNISFGISAATCFLFMLFVFYAYPKGKKKNA